MAVLVLRVEGLETITARFGREAANVLRRKLAVRLRAGVRANDVVASLGDDSYAKCCWPRCSRPATTPTWAPSC